MEESGSPTTEVDPSPSTVKTTSRILKDAEAAVFTSAMDGEEKSEQPEVALSQEKAKEENDDIPKIAITPAMNVSDLVEQLMSHMDAEQRKQFASAIQSKVAVEEETTSCVTTGTVTTTTTTTTTVAASAGINAVTTTSGTCSTDDKEMPAEPPVKESEIEVAVQTEVFITSKMRQQKDRSIENKIPKFKKQFREKIKQRKRKMEDRNESTVGGLAPLKIRKREFEVEQNDVSAQCSSVVGAGKLAELDLQPTSSINLCTGFQGQVEKKQSEIQREFGGKKFIAEKTCFEGGVEKKKKICKEVGEECWAVLERSIGEEPDYLDENMVDHVRELHLDMKRKLNEQLKVVIDRIGKQFASLELNLGDRMHWDLPWYRLNWKEVARRSFFTRF